MNVLARLKRRRGSVASVGTVSIFSTTIVALALTNPGLSTTDVLLNDAGVWVTRSQENLVGRFNASAEVVDGVVTAGTASYDVLQQGDAVLVHHADPGTLSPVDVAGLSLTGSAELPEGAEVALGGRTVAVLDPRDGRLWVLPFDAVSAFSAEDLEPAVELPRGAQVVVGVEGTVHAVGGDRLVTVPVTDQGRPGAPVEQSLDVAEGDKGKLAITAVGSEPVVLDHGGERLRLPDGSWAPVDDAAGAVLQLAGPSTDAVVLATPNALVSQPLDGSTAYSMRVEDSGKPTAPVYLQGCAYGAWSGSAAVARDCAGDADDQNKVLPGDFADARLQYRVNRDVIVLNEFSQGTIWLADKDFQRLDGAFADVLAQRNGATEPEPTTEVSDQPFQPRDEPNRPPVAADDDLGVRPGRTTVLRLLENDSDPDGDVLAIDIAEAEPELGGLQVVHAGAAVQLAVPEEATGVTTFGYTVDDGRGGTDAATVTVTVRPWDDNTAPVQLRETRVEVEQGKAVDVDVLHDWVDPDGDDLILLGAVSSSGGDTVRTRADGLVTFQDAGTSPGSKTVRLTISDGLDDPVEGALLVDVRPAGQQRPVTQPDHVTTIVGRPVTVAPLLNDTDPNGDLLRLVRVDDAAPGVVTADFEGGTFSFVSDVPRVYYVTYSASDGPATMPGLVRIDVLPEPDGAAAPIAVRDTALLPAGGEVLVDVLANDVDPAGGVLVVQSVQVPVTAGVSVELVDHRLLRVRDVRGVTGQVTVGYTVSNGTASTGGEVSVMPVPAAATLRPPVAVDDEVTVRAGDVVTIPVLANDSHPDGAPLSLVPELVEQPGLASGLMFTAEGMVRFQAGPEAGTVYAVYEVTDAQGQKDSAQITIVVQPAGPEGNSAPRPPEVIARVLAGSTVRIPVPLDGIDPDGDSVALLGLHEAPEKGRVSDFGQGWLQYEANRDATGVDTLIYAVEDPYGARATGTVLIGIAPPPQVNQPPHAVDDSVVVRPGRALAVAVMTNDVDPDGDRIQLVDRLEAEGVEPRVELDRILMDVPQEPGVYTVYYTIQDVFGERSTAALAVDVRDDAPLLRPIARDDALTLSDILERTSVDVPVLENDEDPDGSGAELEVTASADGVTVLRDGTLRVELAETARIVPYTVTDPDNLTATAFLRVPGLGSLRPTLRADAGVEVVSGQTLTVRIDDVVVVAKGRSARITEAGRVRVLRGKAAVVDERTLTYVSDPGYFGAAALTFEVTDGASPEDPAGRKAVLTLPITVLPGENEPPTFAGAGVSVASGDEVTTALMPYATDPDPGDAGRLRFSVTGDQPTGMRVSIEDALLRVSVDDSVPPGTIAAVDLAVTDGVTDPVRGSVTITVVASTAPLAAAADDVVTEAFQGRTTVVSVLVNDSNPFPETPLRVVDAAVESDTTSGEAVVQGSDVAVTPAEDFVGTMVVRYRVEDATRDPDRHVEGRVLVTVQGRPDAPTTPTVLGVRNRTVVLSWAPPGNNGSVITGYTVTSPQGYTRECAATTCTLDSLTNDVEYTFRVVASNAVGESDPSPASAPARPDERPNAPTPPTLQFGDRSLAVSWTNDTYTDRSPIQSVTLEISPAPPSGVLQQVGVTGTSMTWEGLENGVPYRVRVQAVNRAPDPSDWSAYSVAEIPAGVPGAPGTPTTQALAPVGNQAQLQVAWPAAAPNGDPVSQYLLTVVRGGAAIRTLALPGTQSSQAVTVDASQDDYAFTVVATNKAGTSVPSAASAPRRGVLTPGPVKALSATPGNNAVQLAFNGADGNGARPAEIRYQHQVNGGGWSNLRADSRVTSGVPNNGTYTVAVRAVSTVDGADYVGPATNANPVAPFGQPGRPSAGADGRERDVVLSWEPPGRNGRDVRIQISIDGGGWQDVESSGSRTVGDDYEQEHSIRVRAVDTEGQVGLEAPASARSANRPLPPRATAQTLKGRDAQGQKGCGSEHCRFLEVHVENWPTETGRVSCQEQVAGTWTEIISPKDPDTFSGTETEEVNCWYGKPGLMVRVVLPNGAIAESIQW